MMFLLLVFFLISFSTKYADWKIYRVEITKAIHNDGERYKNIAEQLVKGQKPVEYLHDFGLRPAFILYLAAGIKMIGYYSDFFSSLANIILISLFLTLLVYMLIKRYGTTGYWLSFTGVIIFIAGNPLILFWSPFILTDIPAMGMLILSMFIYLEMTHKLKYVLLGIVYALAFHIREVTFINFAALIATMTILKESKKNIGIFIFIYVSLIIPWLFYVNSHHLLSPFSNHLTKAISARTSIYHTENIAFLSKFLSNISRHYSLYITDGGPIDSHGYYSIIYTSAMYMLGIIGAISLFVKEFKKEFYLVIISVVLTAGFYGFVGEGPYMRGRVLVEYLLMYAASVGFIYSAQSIQKRVINKA
ncbi:MAG: hypothetical protein A2X34_08325 [Elusimicrobia bacterium GWC2_51_8]|nr:MAG: hypothetical protein A2X34_08325 [Elusimicrobia bacterium GWC2_51_8]HAF96565.1 hypothetical protein [Elusimicrobiota bacterium]